MRKPLCYAWLEWNPANYLYYLANRRKLPLLFGFLCAKILIRLRILYSKRRKWNENDGNTRKDL